MTLNSRTHRVKQAVGGPPRVGPLGQAYGSLPHLGHWNFSVVYDRGGNT